MAIRQWTSNGIGNNYYKFSGGAATPYVSIQKATAYAMPFPGWAKIITNSAGAGDSTVEYMWYQSIVCPEKALTGQTVYFARQSTFAFTALPGVLPLAFSLDVGADNAFYGRLTAIPYIGATQQAPQVYDFSDGNMDISYSNTEVTPPYNWQNVYHFERDINGTARVDSLLIKLEFKVVNYQQPGGSIFSNPGMLQYAFNLHTRTAATETAAIPDSTINPLL